MKKVLAAYGRTSTDKQEKGLEAQERALAEYCKLKEIGDYLRFSDEAFSGKLSSRPQFNQMMAAVRRGEIHTVLVYSFSRFARSTKQLIDSLEEFQKLGVRFVSLTENIDTDSPYGKFMFTIFAAIAQLEREITVERVKNGLKNARAKGKKLGTPKRLDDQTIRDLHARGLKYEEIRDATKVPMDVVLRALELHAAGIELPGIRAELKVPKGTITRILKFHAEGLPVEEIQQRTGASRGTYLRAIGALKVIKNPAKTPSPPV